MTIAEAFSWFDILQDKTDSPYFTDAEKQQIFRRAQNKLATEYVFKVMKPSVNSNRESGITHSSIESTTAGIEVLSPLILEDLDIDSDANGLITDEQIIAAINERTGQDNVGYMEIMAIAYEASEDLLLPVRFVRQNDYIKFKNNIFKAATASQPQYRLSRGRISFSPGGVNTYYITLIKEPVPVVYDAITPANNVEFELPFFTHDSIVAIALDDAGVASRDQALMMLNKENGKNLSVML